MAPEEWKETFRMRKENFMKLCDELRPHIIQKNTINMRSPVEVERQVALTLYYLSIFEVSFCRIPCQICLFLAQVSSLLQVLPWNMKGVVYQLAASFSFSQSYNHLTSYPNTVSSFNGLLRLLSGGILRH